MPYIIIKHHLLNGPPRLSHSFAFKKILKIGMKLKKYVLYYLALDSFSQSELQNQIYIRDIGAGALV